MRGYALVEGIGIVADDALETVLAVQLAMLSSVDRVFPMTLDLAHDYAAYQAMVEVKDRAVREWTRSMPRLRDFPPAAPPDHRRTAGRRAAQPRQHRASGRARAGAREFTRG